MAIWQFDVSFVPRDGPMPWATEDGHEVPPLEEAAAVRAHAWLGERFGEPVCPLEGWIVFGQDQGNRFDLLFNEDSGVQLSARIDLRKDCSPFVEAVCDLASKLNCLLFSAEQWAVIEPSTPALLSAAKRSRAAQFANNPRGFFGE